VILVINHYLGALNHSLLTLSELERRSIPLAGIIFNGEDFQGAEEIILARTNAPCLLRIPTIANPQLSDFETLAGQIRWN
jgi:dethiobiotin synthetase